MEPIAEDFVEWMAKNPLRGFRLLCAVAMVVGAFVFSSIRFIRQPTLAEIAVSQFPAVVWIVVWVMVIWVGSRIIKNKQRLGNGSQEEWTYNLPPMGEERRVVNAAQTKDELGTPITSPSNGQKIPKAEISHLLNAGEVMGDGH